MFVVDDIVIDILVRLPVKSLLRFKCVCKQWKSIIESPTFVSDHMKYQKLKERTCFLVHYYVEREIIKKRSDYWSFFASLCPDQTLAADDGYVIDSPYDFGFSGPVNGWFCLYSERSIVLWNPATREAKPIPNCLALGHECPSKSHIRETHALLGLDNVTNEFKLIQILYYEGYNEIFYRVFSLSTDSWSRFKQFDTHPPAFHVLWYGVYLNGFYYWCWDGKTVDAFDVGGEVFHEITAPSASYFHDYINNRSCVTSYDSSHIGLLVDRRPSEIEPHALSFDIWVMEVESRTWAKILTVAAPRPQWCKLFRPGELIVYRFGDDKVVLWNFVTNETSNLIEGCCSPHGSTYHESLVSFNGGRGGIDQRHDDQGRYMVPFYD